MKTKALYYENPEETTFTARILAREEITGSVRVMLDQTQFYPGGGGQPADGGVLGGEAVLSVRKEDGEIWHHLSRFPGYGIDSQVMGQIDEARRSDFRQQHTGQHILSAAFMKTGNYPTISVHQGEETTTIDFGVPDIPREDVAAAEELANCVVTENRPVRCHSVSQEELAHFKLRRPTKQKGVIRVVEIEEFDQAACGGIHFSKTGRVGLIKFMDSEKIRGNFRTYWSIGKRALADYRRKLATLRELSVITSTPQDRLARRVEDILREGVQKQRALGKAFQRIAFLLADSLAEGADKGVLTASVQEDNAVFKALAQELTLREGLRFCLINIPLEEGLPIHWSFGGGPGTELPFQVIRERLFPLINAKGGGRLPLWQGVGSDRGGVEKFLKGFQSLLAP